MVLVDVECFMLCTSSECGRVGLGSGEECIEYCARKCRVRRGRSSGIWRQIKKMLEEKEKNSPGQEA